MMGYNVYILIARSLWKSFLLIGSKYVIIYIPWGNDWGLVFFSKSVHTLFIICFIVYNAYFSLNACKGFCSLCCYIIVFIISCLFVGCPFVFICEQHLTPFFLFRDTWCLISKQLAVFQNRLCKVIKILSLSFLIVNFPLVRTSIFENVLKIESEIKLT